VNQPRPQLKRKYGIGMFAHDIGLLSAAVSYLRR
jgi:hypothetical protein